MKTKEDLPGLIKSLSKSEKRYFKLFVGKNSIGEGSHYLKLFDLIDKTGTAKKQVIQKLYGNDSFMEQQFKKYKYRLYKQILKSLSAYHSEKSVDDNILESIRQAKILFDRALYPDATKMLEKAKSIACKYEKFTLLLEIIRWQKKIVNVWKFRENRNEKGIVQLVEEENSIAHKMDNANEYWKRYSLLYLSYQKKGVARIQEDVESFYSIIDVPVLKDPKFALSYQAKKDFYMTYIYYYFFITNLKEAYTYAKNMVDLIEAHPHQLEDNPSEYRNALSQLLFIAQRQKKYDLLFNSIPKLKFINKKFQLSFYHVLHTLNLELSVCIETAQFKRATHLIQEIEDISKKQKIKNPKYDLLQANMSYLHFINGEFSKALSKLNLILNNYQIHLNLDKDEHNSIKVFQLILHFDKGNTELLPYLLKSFYRHLMQRKQLYKAESIFIGFIRRILISKKNKWDQIEDFKSLREELLKICKDPMEARFLENFDVISWLKSKIENRSFEEILREKSGYTLKEEND